MPPAAIDRVDQGRAREAVRAVAELVDAVLDDDRQMLVSAQMHGPRAAEFGEGDVPPRLRPAVAVEVREQGDRFGLRAYAQLRRTRSETAPP